MSVVEVRESNAKPVRCSDGFFWRQGAETQKLSRDEIRNFFRAEGEILFDLSPCPRFNYPEDFDRDKFDAWLRLSGITAGSVEDVLVNIEVAERAGDRLLFRNVGVLFFAKNVRHFFSEAYITCLLGRGTDKVHILDRKDFDGGIVADIEDAMRFIERNTRLAYRIKGLRRQNIPEYPMEALREAITNAVMHRDWFFHGANVFVELYADRIEVISPGALPKGMSLADLGHKSVRRNPLVADLLHRIDFIEKAGTGIRRIRDGAKAVDCPEPAFEAGNFVTVTFRPNPEVRELPLVAQSRTSEATDQVAGEVAGEVTGEVTDQVTPPAAPEVNSQVAPQVTTGGFRGRLAARRPRSQLASRPASHRTSHRTSDRTSCRTSPHVESAERGDDPTATPRYRRTKAPGALHLGVLNPCRTGRPDRNDHSRQAAQPVAALPSYRGGAGIPARAS